jgi:hypothetical protein
VVTAAFLGGQDLEENVQSARRQELDSGQVDHKMEGYDVDRFCQLLPLSRPGEKSISPTAIHKIVSGATSLTDTLSSSSATARLVSKASRIASLRSTRKWSIGHCS